MIMVNGGGHDGWKNFATWGVALIINNHESSYDDVTMVYGGSNPPKNYDWIKDFVERLAGEEDDHPDNAPTAMARQMISAGLAEVDWQELHESFLAEQG